MLSNQKADMLLYSNNIYTAIDHTVIDGYIALKGNKIIAISSGKGSDYINENTITFELGDKVICPGFTDVHCFFTGYVLGFVGIDLSMTSSEEEIVTVLKSSIEDNSKIILGHGWNSDIIHPNGTALFDEAFGNIPVVLFAKGGETCIMNKTAIDIYQFTPDTCFPESYYRLLKEVLSNREFIIPEFKKYMTMLNSHGITAIKEMGFDDFYGFTDIIKELEESNELSLRVHFMSQPVGAGANIEYGQKMRELFQGDFVHFSGYNRMTDGSISQLCGDLKKPYHCADTFCEENINYKLIEEETLAVDAQDFRFSLHAQGDAAIHKVLNIYEKCKRTSDGKLLNRHSITDLEFSDPIDLERMGKLGVIAEIYPQIQSIADRTSKLSMIEEKIGMERGKYYWNRRKMSDSNVLLSCGTDLPLLIDNIPESIYHACGMYFPEGGEPFNQQNALTINEVLTAWTKGGAYNLYIEQKLGTLEVGKIADIAVFDANIFETPMEEIRNVAIELTIVNGKIVYQK